MNEKRLNYEKDPAGIEERSFEIIRNALSCYAIDERLLDIAVRVVHAGADFSLANLIEARNGALESARIAFVSRGRIFCDVEMLKAGVSRSECARLGLEAVCFIHDEETLRLAESAKITRAMASVDIAIERGVRIFAFGNAPTALFRLLEHRERGASVDFAAAMPVGFVGAADSKDALMKSDIPSISLRGPRGGSGLCAACINALLRMV
ncbi:MAG: precorrin-8X methylmutase, partial [Synergistaceae bacterium]|nr:precorrin-8X methylmutase [Synergistaceae bacterium]